MRPVRAAAAAILLTAMTAVRADLAYDNYRESFDNGDYLSADDDQTMAALERSERPGGDGQGLGGMVSGAGVVTFSYGSSRPVVVCALLELCDIALEGGEDINSVQIGDSARWQVSTAVSGTESGRVQHLIIKPLDSGLRTSMIIATDRRTYHLQLKSTFDRFMPQVTFVYPGQELESLNAGFARHQGGGTRRSPSAAAGRGRAQEAERLQFDYEWDGDDEIMPERVYHDGQKTYIDMKPGLTARRTPALLIISRRGGLFAKDREHVANYRMQGSRYIVDGVLQEAKLILGEHGENYCVEISYKGS